MVLHRHPLCVACKLAGRVRLSTVADHVVPLDPKNPSQGDWHLKNGQGLCVDCHAVKTASEQLGSYIPIAPVIGQRLTIVCGPPWAGKNTYVRRHARHNDVVIDLDKIKTPGMTLSAAFKRRDAILANASGNPAGRVWLIIGAPLLGQREAMRRGLQPGEVVVLETPATVCKRRAQDDPRGGRLLAAIEQWWLGYTSDDRDTRINTDG